MDTQCAKEFPDKQCSIVSKKIWRYTYGTTYARKNTNTTAVIVIQAVGMARVGLEYLSVIVKKSWLPFVASVSCSRFLLRQILTVLLSRTLVVGGVYV